MSPTIGVNLRVTGNCSQGGRKYMEDMFSVAYQQTPDKLDLEYAFFGMFDGHGGHEAAAFAKEHLMKNIVLQPGFWSEDDDEVLNAIKDGFVVTHYAMWRNLEKWPKTQSGLPSTSGTTASIAFIRKARIYLGHVGDSGIVLGYEHPDTRAWTAMPLTKDHKPETPAELARIRAAGGTVANKSGISRVVWQRPHSNHQGPQTRSTYFDQIPFLAVARSLGDLWSFNPKTEKFVVSPEPDVQVHKLDMTKDRCLILGTDGLFNMLNAQEVVEIVEKAEVNNLTSDQMRTAWLNPSKFLVDHAITKWSDSRMRADNTSAVVLLLDPLGPPSSRVLNSPPNSPPYRIESFMVREQSQRTESSGLAIYTRSQSPTPQSSQPSIIQPLDIQLPATSFVNLPPQTVSPRSVTTPEPSPNPVADDTVPNLMQAISLEDAPENAKKRRRRVRRNRKRKNAETAAKNDLGRRLSLISERETESNEPASDRVTRTQEPATKLKKSEVKNESDSENSDAPMRLRSAVPYKTLRSRNVNLDDLGRLITEEPRKKRSKK